MCHITLSIDGAVATLTLNNPPQNRIDNEMVDQLSAAIDGIGSGKVRALLLRAEGPDFSFGGDIMPWPDMDVCELRAMFERCMSVFNRFERLPIPVIVAVQGLCFGGGLELALRADVIFAGASARFGHPEQTLGLVTLLGGIYRIAERAGRPFASEWAITSQQVPATVMERHGVVNRVIDDDKLLTEANAFAIRIAAGPTRAYAAHKALLRTWANGGIGAADEVMFDIAMPLFETNDVRNGLRSAVNALKAGQPRPVLPLEGR
jgi:enoyl-CoA hydratase/carnithine racemase